MWESLFSYSCIIHQKEKPRYLAGATFLVGAGEPKVFVFVNWFWFVILLSPFARDRLGYHVLIIVCFAMLRQCDIMRGLEMRTEA
jgi:hypothetical protein